MSNPNSQQQKMFIGQIKALPRCLGIVSDISLHEQTIPLMNKMIF